MRDSGMVGSHGEDGWVLVGAALGEVAGADGALRGESSELLVGAAARGEWGVAASGGEVRCIAGERLD